MTKANDLIPLERDNWLQLGEREERLFERSVAIEGRPVSLDRRAALALAPLVRAYVVELLEEVRRHLHGDAILTNARLLIGAKLSGGNAWLIGTSGVAKSYTVLVIDAAMGLPVARVDSNPQQTPADLLGMMLPVGDGRYHRIVGPLATPVLSVFIDEANRMNTTTASVLLQPLEERRLAVPDYDRGAGFCELLLFRGLSVVMSSNPASYAGVLGMVEALLDRVKWGLDFGHPSSEERVRMLADGIGGHGALPGLVEMPFTLSDFRSALRHVTIDERLCRFIVFASWLVSPTEFREQCGWTSELDVQTMLRSAGGRARRTVDDFRQRVDEAFYEGGNPRGEAIVVHNAKVLALMDGRLEVRLEDVVTGFVAAYRMRMKAYPGSDGEVRGLLETACSMLASSPYFSAQGAVPAC